jgi:hypothetical protein
MKSINQSKLLFSVILILISASCKKGIDFIKSGYDQPNAKCLVTHTEDDLFGYSLNIIYNGKGNPDSMNFEGYPATMQYDNKNRLVKANFGDAGTGVHLDFRYKDNTFLPTTLNYYYPSFGGLIAIDSFYYNFKGELIKIGHNNLISPDNNFAETYEYDENHNVAKVTWEAQNGGTVFLPAFTAYEVSKYDHKPNFMSGNQWIKYILMHSELDSYIFMMFSANNAVDWHWGFQGGFNAVTSTLEYNSDGFANKVNLHLFDVDGVTELIAFTRLSSSTCDNTEEKHAAQRSPYSKLSNLKFPSKNMAHLPLTFSSQ